MLSAGISTVICVLLKLSVAVPETATPSPTRTVGSEAWYTNTPSDVADNPSPES